MTVELLKLENTNTSTYVGAITASKTEEVVAFCPRCKTLETLDLSGGQLIPTRKFNQNNGHIYHDCGSTKPCQLLRRS